jgi:hypothetical protein
MKTYTAQELEVIIENHGKWLRDEDGGEKADLSYSNLSYSNLSYSNLSYSNLRGCNLSGCNMRDCNMRGCNLSYSNLSDCNGLIYISQRSDGYQFFATYRDDKWLIQAGCRLLSLAEYRTHTEFYSCQKKRAETLLLIDFAEAMIAHKGIV